MVSIVEYEPRFDAGVRAVIAAGLASAGVSENKYPEIWEQVAPSYISDHYVNRGRFWLALSGEEVIGTIAIQEKDPLIAEIKRMFVAPKFQGKGVGQKLLDTALDFAKSQSYKHVYLETDALMKRAHRFYEKNGFRVYKDYGDWQAYVLDF